MTNKKKVVVIGGGNGLVVCLDAIYVPNVGTVAQCVTPAIIRLSHGGCVRIRCRQAAKSGKERDCGIKN